MLIYSCIHVKCNIWQECQCVINSQFHAIVIRWMYYTTLCIMCLERYLHKIHSNKNVIGLIIATVVTTTAVSTMLCWSLKRSLKDKCLGLRVACLGMFCKFGRLSADLNGRSIYRLCLVYCGNSLTCWHGQFGQRLAPPPACIDLCRTPSPIWSNVDCLVSLVGLALIGHDL